MRHVALAAALATLPLAASTSALVSGQTPAASASALAPAASAWQDPALAAALDAIFAAPVLDRAVMAVRIESLRDGRLVYARQSGTHVVPASNMKLITLAVAADRLGWDYRFETRVETAAPVVDGRLEGDLVVVGTGDPSIGAPDGRASSVFVEWANALWDAGIRRVNGRLIGDDDAFDDEGLGAGWAWDYLADGYATPTGALVYNENVAVARVTPGAAPAVPAEVALAPPGHGLDVVNRVVTGAPESAASLTTARLPGDDRLVISGSVPAGGRTAVRTVAVDNPTHFFVEALRLALLDRGIVIRDGAWDVDSLPAPVRDGASAAAVPPAPGAGAAIAGSRRVLVRRASASLRDLGGYFLKQSQNLYGESLLKALGRPANAPSAPGSSARGRAAVRETLASWGVAGDAVVMYDGSGLSRYNYVTADAIVAVLKRMWASDVHRGPFFAALPVAAWDGTLATRMRTGPLAGRVQAKTGTIANVRSLSGVVTASSGERFVFSMIANHFTAPSAQIDAVVEQALERVAR